MLGVAATLIAACGFPRPADIGPIDGGDGAADDAPGVAACELTAVSPALASTGDTVHLEGTFRGSVTVTFPGGVSRPATVLGPHRATAVVPAEASTGDLTVTTCSATLGPLPFRRVSFPTGLASLGAIADQAGFARQTTRLASPRVSAGAVSAGRYVYVVGGADGSGPLASVEQASVNADGSLTMFSRYDAASLAVARQGHTITRLGDYLHAIGGIGGSPLDSVERAAFARNGALGAFAAMSDVKLAVPRHGHASVVIGNSPCTPVGSSST